MTADELRAASLAHGKAIRCIQEEFTLNPLHPVVLPSGLAARVLWHDQMRAHFRTEAQIKEREEQPS